VVPITEHKIKRGDTLKALVASLTLGNTPIDLTGATVRFIMRPRFTTPPVAVINRSADVLLVTEGRVSYQWQAGDTAQPGRYAAEFEITYTATGRKLTVPNDGYISVVVTGDIG
jgi:hypothetical protein